MRLAIEEKALAQFDALFTFCLQAPKCGSRVRIKSAALGVLLTSSEAMLAMDGSPRVMHASA